MEQHPTDTDRAAVSRARLEFLFDGIFAIAMTILVLELRVPELADRHSVAELARALAHHGATFFSYLLSFAMLGILWHSHNRQYRHVQHVTTGMFALHLVQLAMAAFFPFCAALLGRYPTNLGAQVAYVGCVTVYQWGSLLGWLAARRAGALAPHLTEADYRRYRKGNLVGCAICTAVFLSDLLRALGSSPGSGVG
jgi:uncharacterized membrane protein